MEGAGAGSALLAEAGPCLGTPAVCAADNARIVQEKQRPARV